VGNAAGQSSNGLKLQHLLHLAFGFGQSLRAFLHLLSREVFWWRSSWQNSRLSKRVGGVEQNDRQQRQGRVRDLLAGVVHLADENASDTRVRGDDMQHQPPAAIPRGDGDARRSRMAQAKNPFDHVLDFRAMAARTSGGLHTAS